MKLERRLFGRGSDRGVSESEHDDDETMSLAGTNVALQIEAQIRRTKKSRPHAISIKIQKIYLRGRENPGSNFYVFLLIFVEDCSVNNMLVSQVMFRTSPQQITGALAGRTTSRRTKWPTFPSPLPEMNAEVGFSVEFGCCLGSLLAHPALEVHLVRARAPQLQPQALARLDRRSETGLQRAEPLPTTGEQLAHHGLRAQAQRAEAVQERHVEALPTRRLRADVRGQRVARGQPELRRLKFGPFSSRRTDIVPQPWGTMSVWLPTPSRTPLLLVPYQKNLAEIVPRRWGTMS